MSLTRVNDDLAFASSIIDRVDSVTLRHFQTKDFSAQTKKGFSPAIGVGREMNRIIRAMFGRSRSRDAIYGEEHGGILLCSARRWVIDPIDGTKNFVRGVPAWGTLLALEEEGEIVVGIVSAPPLGRRWWAAKGVGAFTGKSWVGVRRLRVSEVSDLAKASMSYSSLKGWAGRGRLRAFLRLAQRVWCLRAYGDFWSLMLVAEGAVDLACEPELELFDTATLVPIVAEADGSFTSLHGEPGPRGGCVLTTNGVLHPEVLEILGSIRDEDAIDEGASNLSTSAARSQSGHN